MLKKISEFFNSKAFAFSVTIIWALAVCAYFAILTLFDIDAIAGLISVSGVVSIIATNYFVKAGIENKTKITQNPLYNNDTDDNDTNEDIIV